MNRKKIIIALIILNLLLVGTATTLSAYKSHATGDVELEIAKIIFNNSETTSATISLKGMNPGDAKELSFAVSNNGTVNKNTTFNVSNYTNAKVGDEIAIGTEHFYVIANDNGHITALAKYNLNISDGGEWSALVPDAQVGIQNELVDGDNYGAVLPFYDGNVPELISGTIDFHNYSGTINTALYGENGYESYLQNTIPRLTTRLIDSVDLTSLGCLQENAFYSCNDSFSWVYDSYYWTAHERTPYNIWYVAPSRFGDGATFDCAYGVRPVIEFDTIPAFQIVNDLNYNATLDTGDEFAIGSEHFYVLSNNNGQIKALAKYGLNVSDGESWAALVPGAPVGLQNELVDGDTYGAVIPFYFENLPEQLSGTMDFHNYLGIVNTSLYGSSGYEAYLQNTIPGLTTRLINGDDLNALGCLQEQYHYSCNDSFPWLYNFEYWTALARTSHQFWYVAPEQSGDGLIVDCAYGVRPVIEFNMANVPNSSSSDNQVNVRSEVTVEYTLTVSTYYNVPYQIEIINSNNQRVLACNASTGTIDANGVLSCTTEAMTLGYTNDQTDNYKIVISVPNGISSEYSGQADYVTIDISSKQKVTS